MVANRISFDFDSRSSDTRSSLSLSISKTYGLVCNAELYRQALLLLRLV